MRLHSHLLGEGEYSQDNAETYSSANARKLYLSSLIAARGVTLPNIRYVFIHPYARTTFLHQSGLETLGEERINAELNANQTGRAGRTANGVVIYLFEFDDSDEALLELKERRWEERPGVRGARPRAELPRPRTRPQSTVTTSATAFARFRAPPGNEITQEKHAN